MTAVAAGDSRAKKMKENKFYFSETFANFNAFYSVKGFYLLRNVLKTGKAFSILPFVLNSVIFSYVTYLNAQSCNAEGSGMCDPKSASENVLVKSVDYFCEIPTGSPSTATYTGASRGFFATRLSFCTLRHYLYTHTSKQTTLRVKKLDPFSFEHNFHKHCPILTLFFHCCRQKLSAHKHVIQCATLFTVCCCITLKNATTYTFSQKLWKKYLQWMR